MTGAANDNLQRRPRVDSASRQLSLTLPLMARLHQTAEELEELVRALRAIIDGDRLPLWPRIRGVRQVLEKLEPPKAAAETFPPPKPAGRAHARPTTAALSTSRPYRRGQGVAKIS